MGPPVAESRRTRHPLLVALGLSTGPLVAVGLARFAYSLLLPVMRSDLHWTLAQAGAMNTANALGYLAGALGAGPLLTRAGSRRPFLLGAVVTALALLTTAATGNFVLLLALRLVAGVTGALVFIAGGALVSALIAGTHSGRSTAILGSYFAGPGAGIVVSALVVPPVAGLGGGASWRWGWVVLGGTSLVITLLVSVPACLRSAEAPLTEERGAATTWPVGGLVPIMISYLLFGAGYIAYITFIVAYLESEGLSRPAVTAFWAVLGAAAVAAPLAWGPLLARLRAGTGPAAVLGATTVGAAIPLLFRSPAGDFASAILFGGAFLTVVTATTNLARRWLRAVQVAPAIAVMTVFFGAGQSVGPVLAGVLSEGPRGFRTGLELSVALLAAGAAAALFQRPLPGVARKG